MRAIETVTGNQAYLEIKNYNKISWDNLVSPAKGASLSMDTVKDKLFGGTPAKAGSLVKKEITGIEQRGIKDGVIKVQYNPTSLRFTGSMQKNTDVKQVEAQKQKITTVSAWGVLTMSVDLVFHSTSALDTSVMDQMNVILTMMQKSPTKEVVFSWADIVIKGKVTYFSGEYQMFHPSGLPAAGKISLKIEAESEPKKIASKIEDMVAEKPEKLVE